MSALGRALHDKRKAGVGCDVVLAVGDRTFPAHKLILQASSPVFDRMFTGDSFKESREHRVDIKDTSPPVFEKFLELLYLGEVEEWEGHELELLELCDRYLVNHLKAVCEKRFDKMDSRTALGVLTFAAQRPYVSSDLRRKAARVAMEDGALCSKPEWKAFEDSCGVVADVLREALVKHKQQGRGVMTMSGWHEFPNINTPAYPRANFSRPTFLGLPYSPP
ncbi:hypothetical protein ONE63_001113 [Megalurothrips usitatus]|uniref:BTB domain-containing protein n=1 Tax=Megalurothrips usitatus TaxID=439358 RepID=A0AAV7XB31_9NEOP|nr:hypothetical protein ONE63_001113 [Megalurothrips usitatus]